MTTATITSIAIETVAFRAWKHALKDLRDNYVQAGRIEQTRQILTVLNRSKDAIEFRSTEEVERIQQAAQQRLRSVGAVYIQYYFRDAWAATTKGLVKKVLDRKQGTNMEIHSLEEFDALIADLNKRVENGQNRKASATQRDRLVEARALFAPLEQAASEMEGASLIAAAVESPEAARELLVDNSDSDNGSSNDSDAPEQPEQPDAPSKTGVQKAPEGSEKPWRVLSEDGSFTEHTSRKAAREANKAQTVNA